MSNQSPWFNFYSKTKDHPWEISAGAQSVMFQHKLDEALKVFTNVRFDHMMIGHLGRRICVFVIKGRQSVVLYDKTKAFPSAKLLAALTLLGTS